MPVEGGDPTPCLDIPNVRVYVQPQRHAIPVGMPGNVMNARAIVHRHFRCQRSLMHVPNLKRAARSGCAYRDLAPVRPKSDAIRGGTDRDSNLVGWMGQINHIHTAVISTERER